MTDNERFDADVRQVLRLVGEQQAALENLAREAYTHPRHGLWVPLNAAAAGIRGVQGQVEVARHLLDTWAGDRA